MGPFDPFFRNPHLATIAGNFWSRPEVEQRWPVESVLYRTEPDVQVLVHAQRPDGEPKGEIILVHGLEGSSESGYARSMAYAALDRGYSAGRFNLRGCGGTEHLAITSYHAGQTSDVLSVLRERRDGFSGLPLFLAGFSLGGNVALKLAGEFGDSARELLAGVCAVSTPIDLGGLRRRARTSAKLSCTRTAFSSASRTASAAVISRLPEIYTLEHLPKIRTIVDFDNYYTAPPVRLRHGRQLFPHAILQSVPGTNPDRLRCWFTPRTIP